MIKHNLHNAVSCVSCSSYSTWKLLAWWLYILSGLSYGCNPYVGVSCMGFVDTDRVSNSTRNARHE